jgi:hypothetical protein
LRAITELGLETGKLRRVFIWGSFVTAKPAPRDIDLLLIMEADFEVESLAERVREVFDTTRAKLRFESDVSGLKLPLGRRRCNCGLKLTRHPETFENAVPWNWS